MYEFHYFHRTRNATMIQRAAQTDCAIHRWNTAQMSSILRLNQHRIQQLVVYILIIFPHCIAQPNFRLKTQYFGVSSTAAINMNMNAAKKMIYYFHHCEIRLQLRRTSFSLFMKLLQVEWIFLHISSRLMFLISHGINHDKLIHSCWANRWINHDIDYPHAFFQLLQCNNKTNYRNMHNLFRDNG